MSRTAIINITIWIAVFLVIWFGVLPIYREMQPLKESVVNLGLSIEEEKEDIVTLKSLEEELENKTDQVDKLNLAIPTKRDVSVPVAVFEEASTINGLILVSVDVSDFEKDNLTLKTKSSISLKALQVRLRLTGKYSSFRSFIGDVEKSFPFFEISQVLFRISSVELADENANLSNPSLEFDVVLETYYKAE